MAGNIDRTLYAIKVAAVVIKDAKLQQQQKPFIKSVYAKPSYRSKYAHAKALAKRLG